MLKLMFVFLSSFSIIIAIEIQDDFVFCKDKNQFIDLKKCNFSGDNIIQRFEYFSCEIKNQIFRMRSINEDSYFKFQEFVYHVINGSIKNTECIKISKIEVYDQVERCTKDILVSFKLGLDLVYGYLTNENIIRPKSKLIPCSNEMKFVSLNNISIAKKANMIKPFNINKINLDSNLKNDGSLLSYYEKNLELNREYRIGSDILLGFISLLNFIFLLKAGKIKLSNLLRSPVK
jgi:hypothetical protein